VSTFLTCGPSAPRLQNCPPPQLVQALGGVARPQVMCACNAWNARRRPTREHVPPGMHKQGGARKEAGGSPDSTPFRTWAMLPGAPLHVSRSSTVRAAAAAARVVLTTISVSMYAHPYRQPAAVEGHGSESRPGSVYVPSNDDSLQTCVLQLYGHAAVCLGFLVRAHGACTG